MKLANKVAIVTGGAGGIGRAIALRLAKEGADVVVPDINLEQANKVVHEIEGLGRRGIATKTDVSNSEEVKLMAKTALDKLGEIDILVNNAGGHARERSTLFSESTEEVWDYVLGVNLKGMLNCTRAVINHMIERRSGKIISIGSVSGMRGSIKRADYSAAKAAYIGFTMALAKEVALYGINVNCVSPGAIAHPRTPKTDDSWQRQKQTIYLRRFGQPEDIANVVAFLASDEASYIVGQNIAVCGGASLGGIVDEGW